MSTFEDSFPFLFQPCCNRFPLFQSPSVSNIEVVDLETDVASKKRSMGPSEERDGGGSSAPPGEKAPRVALAGDGGEAAAPAALGETAGGGAGARGQGDGGRSEWRDIKLGSVENLRRRLEERSQEGRMIGGTQ